MFLIKFRLEMFMFLLEREGQGAWVREGKENKEGGKGGEQNGYFVETKALYS